MLPRVFLFSFCLSIFTLSLTVLQPGAATAQTSTYGCTEVFNAFRSAINAHDKHLMKYAAFARGRAFTITGMKGCGWAHGKKSQAEADRVAMENCRKDAKNPDKCYIALRYKD
ncbi:hypothetical protein [Labrenzia sp. OB1]|uniref:hypothetical protein n=1 Tax=Labrenzia sp. OB1 TaxID=1561204 RepID=UPI0007B253E7|nr:hypothetical protein [Labrenzia sp. OB1]KZM48128.1 hypothetical protein OA90_22380 [Labrenzia sp. OB1]